MPKAKQKKSKLRTKTTQFKKDALSLMLKDNILARTVVPKIPRDMFESNPEMAEIFDELQKFVAKYDCRPRHMELHRLIEDECKKVGLDPVQIDNILKLHRDLTKRKNYTPSHVKDQLYDGVVIHKLTAAIDKAPDLLDQGEYDTLVNEVVMARSSVVESGPLIEFWADSDDRVKRRSESVDKVSIPTGIKAIDEMTGGGLPRGALGIVVASSGKGKSAILTNFAMHSSIEQYVTSFASYELDQEKIMDRCDAIATHIPMRELAMRKNRLLNRLAAKLGKHEPAPLFVHFRPTKSETITDLRIHLDQVRNETGWVPDALFVDYFDLLKMEGKYQNKHEALEENIERLRGLAGEYDLALWTASQTNRGGIKKDEVGAEDIAGAYAKIFPADFVLTVAQSQKESRHGVFRLHVEKSRICDSGDNIWVRPNFEKMLITTLDQSEVKKHGFDKGLKYARAASGYGNQA